MITAIAGSCRQLQSLISDGAVSIRLHPSPASLVLWTFAARRRGAEVGSVTFPRSRIKDHCDHSVTTPGDQWEHTMGPMPWESCRNMSQYVDLPNFGNSQCGPSGAWIISCTSASFRTCPAHCCQLLPWTQLRSFIQIHSKTSTVYSLQICWAVQNDHRWF